MNESILWKTSPHLIIFFKELLLILSLAILYPIFIRDYILESIPIPPDLPTYFDLLTLYFVLFLLVCFILLKRSTTIYILTETRLIFKDGIFTRLRNDIELYRIKDYRLIQPIYLAPFNVHHLTLFSSDYNNPIRCLKGLKNGENRLEQIRNLVESLRIEKGVREID